MQARHVVLLVLAVALAGCASAPPTVEPPDHGRFETVSWTCGFVPYRTICTHWQLDADGSFIAFEGAWSKGNGSINATGGSMHNVTPDGVREILRTFDLYNASRNYTVDLAYRGHAIDAEIGSLQTPAARFYETQRHYEDATVADAGTLNILVESQRGLHRSSAYTGEGDAAFNTMREAFWDVRDAVADRVGVPQDRR